MSKQNAVQDEQGEAVEGEASTPNIYAEYETDIDLETSGVWVRDIRPGIHVKLARLGNPKYRAIYQRRARPYRGQIDRNALSPEMANELVVYAVARAVLLDWENVTDREGNKLENTVENKEKLLADLPDFREDVLFASREAETFKRQETEGSEKN